MEPIKICYIDDEQEGAQRIKRILEVSGDFLVETRPPTPHMGSVISFDLPDLFLIDYVLDAKQADGSYANYRGSTLITAIRETAPDHPVVLITRPSLLDSRQKHELQSRLRIDHIFYKDEVSQERDQVADEIANLAKGFRFLRDIPREQRTWANLLGALESIPQEADLLRRAAPPLYQGRGASEWSIPEAADWIRNTVLAYPGILYDPIFSATELRISVESFQLPEVQDIFSEAEYRGVFAPVEGRWWRERLWRTAMEYTEDSQFADKFAAVFRQNSDRELTPSRSIVRGEEPADAVCYIYHEPVMYKYTLAYRPDNRPPVMDPARISFKAINRGDPRVQEALIEGASGDLLDEIREMEL